MQFGHDHDFPAPAARVGAVMCDPAFQVALDLPDLARPQVVAHEVDGASHRLALRFEYVGQLDPVAQKFVGTRRLTWVQDLRLDVSTGTGTLGFAAEGAAGRADGTARIGITATGDATSRRRIRGDFRVRVPIVGATAERRIVPGLLRRLDVEAEALAAELAR